MAIKKSELYSTLWRSCDELRGGMEPSEYKNYILTLLFVKYVSDKYRGALPGHADVIVPEDAGFEALKALRGKASIGKEINSILARLARENGLEGVINATDFDDESKLGSGQEKVDKLTNIINIFDDERLSFSSNRASDDDIIGDAYEYLMRNFARESGKSKGQFYTPTEVSRVMAKMIGIEGAKEYQTLYDMACGSGSLLIRAAEEAPVNVKIYGQEKEKTTGGLAKMNLVLHNKPGTIWAGKNTLSDPQCPSGGTGLAQYDFCIANPPFSYKSWMQGIRPSRDERFKHYDVYPPKKNGDFAWLLHFIHSMKEETGKGAIILPHGVLFRGNVEETLRAAIVRKRYIKGIIGLPLNLFFGTAIAACIIVLDKENTEERKGIFMIDASRGYKKDGSKNRLRERDIHRIITTFLEQDESDPKYARMVPFEEIEENGYTLHIPRYIDSSISEDIEDVSAHISGGIPNADIEALGKYWSVLPSLNETLFTPLARNGYSNMTVPQGEIRRAISKSKEFINYGRKVEEHITIWVSDVRPLMDSIEIGDKPKELIQNISEMLLSTFSDLSLLDKYDVYQTLMDYWDSTMEDDLYLLVSEGWKAGNDVDVEYRKRRDGTLTPTIKDFEGRLIPKKVIIEAFFSSERDTIEKLTAELGEVTALMEQIIDEEGSEDGLLLEVVDKGKVKRERIKTRIQEIKGDEYFSDELEQLKDFLNLMNREMKCRSALRVANKALNESVLKKYSELTLGEIKDLVINKKWCSTIEDAVRELYTDISISLASRITELHSRYSTILSSLNEAISKCEAKVEAHLERLGYRW
ncbi:MAG: SAM-dependent DNA methyltransferase [Clostridiales bacterium]|nr:SAM-dependent DNA methyltransferase [Clostridiales bacterium]